MQLHSCSNHAHVMVTILTIVVSQTVLLVTVCKCVYRTFCFFRFLFLCFFFFVALVVNKGIVITIMAYLLLIDMNFQPL